MFIDRWVCCALQYLEFIDEFSVAKELTVIWRTSYPTLDAVEIFRITYFFVL
jgi:hypothetical protein